VAELRVSADPTARTHSNPVPPSTTSLLPVISIAVAVAAMHIATNGRYGFHRDELQFLSDARHLDWGYVSYPPLTPFIERISLGLFGLSLIGLRMFSVIGQAVVILVSGLMARDLGGGRLAQVATALSVALSGLPLFEGTEFQYTSFSFLWWVLVCWFIIRLLKTENPRWWLAIGSAIGLGLLTKYSVVFFVAGLLIGLVFTRGRRYFLSPWFWAGVAVALVLFLPNIVWLMRHDFISYRFLQSIHARDVGQGRADGYWKYQFLLDVNPIATPLWIIGLIAFLRDSRYRVLAWMYLVPVLFFWIDKGRFYYVAETYPVLLAMGAAVIGRWLSSRPAWGRRTIATAYFIALISVGAFAAAQLLPIASSGPLRAFALSKNGDLREEIGWDELVHTVASIRDSLPPEQREHFGITTGNYGEYGAIEILGRAYGLPTPFGTTNSEWLRGYPPPSITTFIVLGISQKQANSIFTGCRLAGHNGNSYGVENEESRDHPDIFVCGPPRRPWPEFWKDHQDFG
jgi:hypothetical protein